VQLEGGTLTLRVGDDGKGGDPQTWSHGLGLGGVRKRVRALGGSVHWQANGKRGILCVVTVPHLGSARSNARFNRRDRRHEMDALPTPGTNRLRHAAGRPCPALRRRPVRLPRGHGRPLPLVAITALPPCRPGKIIGLWNNFRAAADKNGWAVPAEPLYFLKSPGSAAAHGQAIPVPARTTAAWPTKVNW
jgi:hypothetical protein